MDGFHLYQEIKKIHNKIKVCFLTASEMEIFDLHLLIGFLNQLCWGDRAIGGSSQQGK
jgi:hypothetical protein